MNHSWRVVIRLFNHRPEGSEKRSQGRVKAAIIKGIPSSEGLENWLNRLSVMVRFKVRF